MGKITSRFDVVSTGGIPGRALDQSTHIHHLLRTFDWSSSVVVFLPALIGRELRTPYGDV